MFHSNWKKAIIIPIPKRDKPPLKVTSYRPIALTSSVCKLAEKLVASRLKWFIESKQIISKWQSGFRRNRCTIDNLVYLESSIIQAFNKGEISLAVFIDIECAFDRIWKRHILDRRYTGE